MEYNGGAVIAMCGKDCVAIGTDMRLGAQFQTISFNFPKVFQMHDRLFVGITGFASDVQSLKDELDFSLNLYNLSEERQIQPQAFSSLISSMLYKRRFGPWFVEPIVAGLKEDSTPFISGMDIIGAPVFSSDFVVSGTCTENLNGMCEALFRPNMAPDELFEAVSQCLLNAVDRDAFSGWGAVVHIITKDGVTTSDLKARLD